MTNQRPTTPAQRLSILGLLLLLAGFLYGCMPAKSAGHHCGTGWFPETDENAQELDSLAAENGILRDTPECDDARSGVRKVALGLMGGGAAALVAGWVVGGVRVREDDEGGEE